MFDAFSNSLGSGSAQGITKTYLNTVQMVSQLSESVSQSSAKANKKILDNSEESVENFLAATEKAI